VDWSSGLCGIAWIQECVGYDGNTQTQSLASRLNFCTRKNRRKKEEKKNKNNYQISISSVLTFIFINLQTNSKFSFPFSRTIAIPQTFIVEVDDSQVSVVTNTKQRSS
jgi:hypothetical protein